MILLAIFIALFLFAFAFVFVLALSKAAKLGDRYERPEPAPTAWTWPESPDAWDYRDPERLAIAREHDANEEACK